MFMNHTSLSLSGAENSEVSEDVKLLFSSDDDTVDDIVDMVGSLDMEADIGDKRGT